MKKTRTSIQMMEWAPAVLAASLSTAAHAAIIAVPGDQPNIQAAIGAAKSGDEIVLADLTFSGAGNKDLTFLDKAITLRSESGNRDACIIDCEGAGRFAMFFSGDTATVRSITVVNGNQGFGGAVLALSGSSPSFIDCAFRDCTAIRGGAIRVERGGDPTIDGCSFVGNVATDGGGGVDADGGRISRSIFLDNVAEFAGGGARIGHDFEEISDSLFQGNVNAGLGGGGGVVVVAGTSASLRNVVFLDNRAQFGGGAGIHGTVPPTPTFVNCLFAGNEAAMIAGEDLPSGGAVDASSGASTFVNCSFSDNTSGEFAGAVSAYLGAGITLVNCVLWNNDAPTGPEIRVSYPGFFEGGTVTVSYSDVAGGEAGVSVGTGGTLQWGDGNIDEDPLLDEHYRPAAVSPCIDAGDNTAMPKGITDDIDGRRRFVDHPDMPDTGPSGPPVTDMGVHEFQTCATDLDRNETVGFADLVALLVVWGPYELYPPAIPEDIDHDGAVGFADLSELLATWGPCE